jgi:DNA mismatch repair protein MutL
MSGALGVIRVLDGDTVNRISAGEVIERPASVVKELVENSLDAGAGHVEIGFSGAGLTRISVTDDGCGMTADDARLAFERHATSKIRRLEDLQSLSTLGFRGEALPSIAAVSRLRLTTRPPDQTAAYEVTLEGGRSASARIAAAAPGTTVVVEDLFFNTPARLKFLRTPATEAGRIVDTVCRIAAARPDVAFRLRRDDNLILSTPGRGDLGEVLLAVWNLPPGDFVALADDGGDHRPSAGGLLARPDRARGNRQYQYLSVNGRPIDSRLVSRAVEDAFAGALPRGRHPVYALRLEVGPARLDVNVHPAKREVRFADDQSIFQVVHRAVKAALSPEHTRGGALMQVREGGEGEGASRVGEVAEPAAAFPAAHPPAERAPGEHLFGPSDAAVLTCLRPLGQIAGQLIAAAGPDGLYLVDQHAAHERILFERLAPDPTGGTAPPGQPLLTPLPVRVTPRQATVLEDAAADLASLGFVIDSFGPRDTILVRQVPAAIAVDVSATFVGDLLDRMVRETGRSSGDARPAGRDDPPTPAGEVLRRSVAACHGSVRAHKPMSSAELTSLLGQLALCAEPFTCPHGRPTVIRFPLAELRRRFGRRGA